MLALTFADPADYDKIRQNDIVNLIRFEDMAPGVAMTIKLTHSDGTEESFQVNHTFNQAQIDWVTAGSALNKIRKDMGVA